MQYYAVQPIECVAAIAWEAEKPLDVTIVVVDPPKKGEVRIRVSALCSHSRLTQPALCYAFMMVIWLGLSIEVTIGAVLY